MKRISIFVILTVLSLSLSAQLPRKVLGFTLGKTTRVEVENYFKQNGKKYDAKKEDNEVFIQVANLNHEGMTWPTVQFWFYQSELVRVIFKREGPISKEKEIKTSFQKTSQKISTQYGKYLNKGGTTDKEIIFKDKETKISVVFNKKDTTCSLSLRYYDIDLHEKSSMELYEIIMGS